MSKWKPIHSVLKGKRICPLSSSIPIWFTSLALLLFVSALRTQESPKQDDYLNPKMPLERRANDLVGRMTLAEKVSQMEMASPAIPRLHIGAYRWWNEGLHGVVDAGNTTLFPQAIGLAATWNTDLMAKVGDTISTEARVKYFEAQQQDSGPAVHGLTFWTPNVNIFRDPRWGRGQETYGEDPFLTGQIGSAFVRGLQGSDPRYLKVVATPKHFAVHSGPESARHVFDAVVSAHDLEDTYLPAFRELIVGAHADSIMCSYNSVDGSPACASDLLLQQKLRRDWHFDGFVVSDCGAVGDITLRHKFAPDMPHAAALAVKAGTDFDCGREYRSLTDAVHQGLITEAEIDTAVKRLFTARLRLGMFDPQELNPYNKISSSVVDSPEHAALALEAARASMVLLKNNSGILPLHKSLQSIAVIGPSADALQSLVGNYNAIASHPVTPLAALEKSFPGRIVYAQGSSYVEDLSVPVPETLFTAPTHDAGEHGLKAEFFNNLNLTGDPVLSRIDRHIDFDWSGASPAQGVSDKTFSVRWTGSITPPAQGKYTLSFSMAHCGMCEDEESIRVWLDDKVVYDFKHARSYGRRAPTPPFDLEFKDRNPHPIRIEYAHDAPHYGAGLTFNWQPLANILRDEAVAAAAKSDVIIAFLGLTPEIEREEAPVHAQGFNNGDRTTIELPAVQQQLVAAVAATGKPLIIVLLNGSALALQSAADTAGVILEAWYPGEGGGTAIAETLLGENNPSGRLPVTFYASTSQLPPFDDYSMKNRTYRYFDGTPLYAFGHGLSYTHFQYTSGKLSARKLKAGKPLTVTAEVKNTGEYDGDETVEIYLVPKAIAGAPLRTLVGFEKVRLTKSEVKTVKATIDPRQLSLVAPDGSRSVQPGEYSLYIGGGQPATGAGIFLPFQIQGSSPIAP